MNEKTAAVRRNGASRKGHYRISTETGVSGAFRGGLASRFEDARRATNLEEILGAAHAACFTMAFSFACDRAGCATCNVDTQATVRLASQDDGVPIERIALTMQASVPGISEATFKEIASATKRSYPMSKALASVPEITLEATLLP